MKKRRSSASCKLLAALGIISLQFSVCTGGFLSVTSAMAAGIPGEAEELNMSVMDADFILCQMFSPIQEVAEGTEPSGCTQGESCLQHSQVNSKERATILFASTDQEIQPTNSALVASLANFVSEIAFRSRSGPLHENSSLLAHAVIKRE